jgi:hypothetical protein
MPPTTDDAIAMEITTMTTEKPTDAETPFETVKRVLLQQSFKVFVPPPLDSPEWDKYLPPRK